MSDNIDADNINANPPPADNRVADVNGGDSESRLSILSQFAINLVNVTDKEELYRNVRPEGNQTVPGEFHRSGNCGLAIGRR